MPPDFYAVAGIAGSARRFCRSNRPGLNERQHEQDDEPDDDHCEPKQHRADAANHGARSRTRLT